MDLFRPFTTHTELTTALKELGYDDEAARITDVPVLHTGKMHDTYHRDRQELNIKGTVELLPQYPDRLVKRLLSRKFKSALGGVWRDSGKQPVISAAGGIFPRGYRQLFHVDRVSCNQCHRSANTSVNLFDNKRDWYGSVPGGDRILSFHIFDPSCISYNGKNPPVVLNKQLETSGMLRAYHAQEHPNSHYTFLK